MAAHRPWLSCSGLPPSRILAQRVAKLAVAAGGSVSNSSRSRGGTAFLTFLTFSAKTEIPDFPTTLEKSPNCPFCFRLLSSGFLSYIVIGEIEDAIPVGSFFGHQGLQDVEHSGRFNLGPSLRSGFRLRAPASLAPARRLKFESLLRHQGFLDCFLCSYRRWNPISSVYPRNWSWLSRAQAPKPCRKLRRGSGTQPRSWSTSI